MTTARAWKHPTRTATAFDAALIADRVADVAAALQTAGVTRVGLYADNGVAWVVADRAIRLAGGVSVPLPHFFSDAQLAHVAASAGLDAVVGDATLDARRSPLALAAPRAVSRTTPALSQLGLALYPRRAAAATPLPAGCAKITFTSGSTGDPKGVCLSGAHLDGVTAAVAAALRQPGGRHLCLLPLSVLLEDVAGVAAGLHLGEVIAPSLAEIGWRGGATVDTGRLAAAVDRYRPATLILLPQLLAALVGAAASGWRPPDSLRFCAVGGARVAPELIDTARQSGLPVYEGYGLSECGSVVALNLPGADRPGSVGRALPGAEVAIQNGEIVVTGRTFLGYLGEPAPAGAIATGDLGHLDADGFLHLAGRRKNLLITALGRNVSPEWVEAELTADGTVAQAVVVGDDRPWLAALVWALPAQPDTAVQARIDAVNARLPDYARVARWRRLPAPLDSSTGALTANGRPRRAAIAHHFRDLIEALYAPGEMP